MKEKLKNSFEVNKSVRHLWYIDPVTKVMPSKKAYSRKNFKQQLKKEY